jgi:pimeloyl-ACP methyl ester carboxylesterase
MVGYGTSIPEGRGRDISVARQADSLASWMTSIGIERAVVVGHDLGGGVAQILAVRHPTLVRGLVLMNAICYDSWPIPSVKAMRALSGLIERAPDALIRPVIRLFIHRGHAEISGDLPRLRLPARLVWGAADRFQKIAYGERLSRDLGAPLTRIDGGKHFVPEDHPQPVADAVNDLLEEIRSLAAA